MENVRITWRCPTCDTLHIDDSSNAMRCRCGTEWDPLRAPRAEVDAYIRAMGLSPDALREEGRELVSLLLAERERRHLRLVREP